MTAWAETGIQARPSVNPTDLWPRTTSFSPHIGGIDRTHVAAECHHRPGAHRRCHIRHLPHLPRALCKALDQCRSVGTPGTASTVAAWPCSSPPERRRSPCREQGGCIVSRSRACRHRALSPLPQSHMGTTPRRYFPYDVLQNLLPRLWSRSHYNMTASVHLFAPRGYRPPHCTEMSITRGPVISFDDQNWYCH